MDYQKAINKANQQISEKMKREIFERLSVSPIDEIRKCDGRVSAYDAIISAVDEARRCHIYEKMEEASGLRKFYEEVYPQFQENLKMLAEYQAIGTPEECREAVEKQKAKVPYYEGDGYADGELIYDTWICPNCGKTFEVDYDDYDYCPECGQHIDWGKEGNNEEINRED